MNIMTDEIEVKQTDNTGIPQTEHNQKETPPENTFTQAEVNRMLAREKNDGRRSAYKDLGIDPKNTADIAEIKELIASRKPESQKLAEKQIEENNRFQEMQARAFLAEVKAEILQAGIQKDYIDDASALLSARKNDEGFDIAEAVETMKTKYPIWFTPVQTEKPEGLKGTGNPIRPGRVVEEKTEGIGTRIAKQRQNGTSTPSVWG
jgi:hypothetical protein